MKAQISTVMFDMDGLMFDTEAITRDAWLHAMADKDFLVSDDLYLNLIGLSTQNEAKLLSKLFGEDFPYQEIHNMEQRYVEEFLATHSIPKKPCLDKLLNLIDDLKLKKAVASSTIRANVEKWLTITGLISRFDIIIGGDEVKNGKPLPDIFLQVARRLNVIPEQCLVLEDSNAGVRAAYDAKMIPIMIPDLQPPSDETTRLAFKIFSSLCEVEELFQKHFTPVSIKGR